MGHPSSHFFVSLMKTPSAASQAASVVASIMVMSSASWGASDDPPRYRLSPGEQLTYHGHEEFKYQTGSFITEESMRIWVLSQNAAGGWKVLAECEGSERRIDSRPEMNQPAREEVAWIRADIGSDGRQENIESTLTHPIALPQIIPLPRGHPGNETGVERGERGRSFAGALQHHSWHEPPRAGDDPCGP